MGFFTDMKEKFGGTFGVADRETEESEDQYVEIGHESAVSKDTKVIVRPFVMEEFEDIKDILDSLRGGRTIALINIQPLKDKDLTELKRAINKIKKTCDAIEGDVAGFGDDWICVTPSFAQIFRTTQSEVNE